MQEEVQFIIDTAEEGMQNSVSHLEKEYARIRAGKANPHVLDDVVIDYYGVPTPLNQTSNISTPDAKTIIIQPWDKSQIQIIEKAIMAANLGFNPVNNGELIRIPVPPLSEERRRDLVKQIKTQGEEAKISIRSNRRTANDEFKNMKKEGLAEDDAKNAESKVQKLHDNFIEKVDELFELKEKDLMTV